MPIYAKTVRIIATIAGRMTAGPELNRNEEYVDLSVNYTIDLFQAAQAIKACHPLLRPIFQFYYPEIRRMKQHYQNVERLVIPVLKARRKAAEDCGPDYVAPYDFMQWFHERNLAEGSPYDLKGQAHMQLLISLASIHTTSMCCTHVLYDLAFRPEYLEPLRQEIDEAFASEGGQLCNAALQRLQKLDSFMKESQRFNPPSLSKYCITLQQVADTKQ